MKYTKGQWSGNKWPCIELDPFEPWQFMAVLLHLQVTYKLDPPKVIDILDGYVADFEIGGCRASLHMDNWWTSLAFAEERVRDRVFEDLQALPPDFFERPARTVEPS